MSVENFEKEEAAAQAKAKGKKPLIEKDLPDLEGTPDETPQVPAHVADVNVQAHSLDDDFLTGLFNEVETKKTTQARELTSDYLDLNTFKDGEERNYVFTNMTTFTKPDTGEVIPAVNLVSKERQSFICASTLVVQSLNKVDKLPAAIRIQVNGKKKGKNGNYFDVRVFVF